MSNNRELTRCSTLDARWWRLLLGAALTAQGADLTKGTPDLKSAGPWPSARMA